MKTDRAAMGNRYAIAAITIAAAALRFFRLGTQSMWTDEMLSVHGWSAPEGVPFGVKLLWDIHGPLYSLFMHLWSGISLSTAWLRVPSALAGTAAVPLLYRWLEPIAGKRVALAGALLLACSPFALYYSQEVRFYSFLLAASILALIVYRRFLETPTMRRGALLGLALLLACLCHFSAGFLCLGLLVHLLVAGRRRGGTVRPAILAAAIVLVGISPWIYREIQFLRTIRVVSVSTIPVEERYRGEYTLSPWAWPYSLYVFATGYSFGPGLRELHRLSGVRALFATHAAPIAVVVLLFGGLLLNGLRRAGGRLLALWLSIAAAAAVSMLLLTTLNVKIFNPRYLTSAYPVFIALLARGVPRRRGAAVVCAACLVMLFSAGQYFFVPRYWRDDIRGAARIVEEAGRPGDLVLSTGVKDLFDFYYDGPVESVGLYPDHTRPAVLADLVRERLDAGKRVWLVRTRTWETDPGNRFTDAIDSIASPARRDSLPGVEIRGYGPAAGGPPR